MSRSTYLKTSAATAVMAVAMNCVPTAFAQTAPSAAPSDRADAAAALDTGTASGGDIVVTARRHEERLKDVPLAITAVTAETLQDAGVRDLKSIIALTPGVTIDGNSAESNQVPVIRGQYNLNNAPGSGGQPNVAVFLDGIYLQNSSAISIGLLDLARVEIVKGPVSSLYGRNGFAGAINYVSKKPTDQWHSTGLARGGEYGTVTLTADVNGPIVPGVLRVGLAGNYQRSDGGYRDSVTGRRAGGFEKKDFKGTFDLDVTDRFNIGGGLYYGNDHFDQTPNVYATNNCANGLAVCGPYIANPIEISNIPASSGNSGNTREIYAGNLHASYDLGFATLSYLGGYNKVTQRGYQDFTALRNGLTFILNPGPGTVNVYELFGADNYTRDYSHQLRLSSPQDSSLRLSVGADYFNSRSLNTTLIGLNGGQIPAGQSVASAANFFLAGLFVTADGRPSTSNFTQTVTDEETYAAFGSVDYDILPSLTLSGEVRYTDDRQNLDIQRNSFVANTFRPFGLVPGIKFHFTNYRAAAKYKLSGQTNVYASIATGTKAGGFNGRATIASELSYQPEDNTTYEVGIKTSTPDNRFGFEAALYHIDSSGLQINGISDDPQNVGQVVKNFGGTRNTGFELSSFIRPTRGLVVNLGFAYTDPKFTAGSNDINGVAVCALVPSCAGRIVTIQTARGPQRAVSLQGYQLPRSSKYQVNIAVDYKHGISASLTGFAHIDYRFESRQYSGVDDLYYIPDRSVVNVRVGVGKGPFELALVARNLLNDKTPVYPTQNTQLNNFSNLFVANLPDPRIVSGELTYRF